MSPSQRSGAPGRRRGRPHRGRAGTSAALALLAALPGVSTAGPPLDAAHEIPPALSSPASPTRVTAPAGAAGVAAPGTGTPRPTPARTAARGDRSVRAATSAEPSIPTVESAPVVPPSPQEYRADLTTALRLAEVENPEIGEARQRIVEALALQQAAQVLLLPTLNAGFNFHSHTGNLQRSSGRILNLDEQSLYVGAGARTLAAESVAFPGVNIASPLADALFEPLAARQNVARARFEAAATSNAVLLDVATLYFELAAAETALGLRRETESQTLVAARLTAAYAQTGQGYRSDADRAATLTRLIHREVEGAEEEAAVASARLARRLHLDQAVRLRPMAPGLATVTLIDPATPTEELVQTALRNRPEMGARASAIAVAQTRLRAEIGRPLLPTLWLGFSGGGFGGGSNLVNPYFGNFRGRTDFDVRVFWTAQNLGFGNLALQRRRRAEVGLAAGEQALAVTTIRREVAGAQARAVAARGRIDITARQLATSEAGFREDLTRLRNTVGRPLELTNSIELLARARIDHLRAILDYDRAQVQLFVALGSPPPLDRPATEPLPPAPIATPILPLPRLGAVPPSGEAPPTGPGAAPATPAVAARPAEGTDRSIPPR